MNKSKSENILSDYTLVIRLFGQSNALGRGGTYGETPEDIRGNLNLNIWDLSTFSTYNIEVNAMGDTFSIEPFLAELFYSEYGVKLNLVQYASGGTLLGIDTSNLTYGVWHPLAQNSLYQTLKTRTENAFGFSFTKTPIILADIWIQGESDAFEGEQFYSLYEPNERLLIDHCRKDIDTLYNDNSITTEALEFYDNYKIKEVPFIDVQLSTKTVYDWYGKQAVRNAKSAIFNDIESNNIYLIPTEDVTLPDGQHYDTESLELIANKIFLQLKKILE